MTMWVNAGKTLAQFGINTAEAVVIDIDFGEYSTTFTLEYKIQYKVTVENKHCIDLMSI